MKKLFIFAISALLLAGCQEGNTETTVGEGKIAIAASALGEVATRADGVTIEAPELAEFSLLITGTDFEKSWASLSDYRTDDERYLAGDYNVSIAWGDATEEGYSKPSFYASEDCVVLDRNRTTTVNITATVANAIVVINTTEAFDNYFPVSDFTVTTTANTFEYDKQATEHLFVAAGQDVKIDCTCIRQANVASGKTEALATQTIASTTAATRYVVTYDLTSTGGVTISVTLNDTVIDTIDVETELNPNA
ncbi:MAG: DUF4493 domain-containing protein [Alistipes sp.]|nr:DUF4493 domain-containing protein [Alistipes sp.]